MIKNIIAYFFIFDLFLAVLISVSANIQNVDIAPYFLSFVRSTSEEVSLISWKIPDIPKIDLQFLDELKGSDFSVFYNFVVGFFDFLNGIVGILNFVVSLLNVLIKLLTFIFVFIKNIYNMRDAIVNASSI